MLSRFFASRNLHCDDGVVYIPQFLDKPQEYLSWKDVETCLTRDDLYWELINGNGEKRSLPEYKPYWSPVPCQDKNTIYNHITSGESFVITGYSKIKRKTQDLCIEIERSLDVCTDVHVYGARTKSPSFKTHCDHFSNFIIQCVGETPWKVYKNKQTSLLACKNDKPLNYDIMEVDWEGILKPGDLLYIPDRAYHCALPDKTRLSMSIPCVPTVLNPEFYDRRNYKIQTDN
tara:strand:- start:387 stop:1079 length:693 start_codon:yes stop_codon:yes gene_type:complete